MSIISKHPFGFLVLSVALYVGGFFFIKPTDIGQLKEIGVAVQEEYTYIDNEGEEHEGESYIKIAGIGNVLTYKDVYSASVAMIVIAMVIGAVLWGDGVKIKSHESLRHIVFANCILGVLLIWITTKETIVPTIFFWSGIVTAYIVVRSMKSK